PEPGGGAPWPPVVAIGACVAPRGAFRQTVRDGGRPAGIFLAMPLAGQGTKLPQPACNHKGRMFPIFPAAPRRYLVAANAPYPNPRGLPIVPVDNRKFGPRGRECAARFAEMSIRR